MTDQEPSTATIGLPDLGEAPTAETLGGLSAGQLDEVVERLREAERETLAGMSPFDRHLKEIRARAAQVATEQRRRERADRTAARVAVREAAKSGQMPSLAQALEAPDSGIADARPLAELPVFLATGGEARLGYPTRPGSIVFTDGRSVVSATTWGDARRHFAGGLDPGTASLPGVRVHLVGTRIEKVVAPDELLVGEASGS